MIGKILSSNINIKSKYLSVNLKNNGLKKRFYIHRLVYEAFLSKIKNGLVINHKNGIKKDNRVFNLETVTQKQNIHHSIKTGLTPPFKGQDSKNSKLLNNDVILIKKHLARKKINACDLAKMFDVSQATISGIKSGKTWAHIKGEKK